MKPLAALAAGAMLLASCTEWPVTSRPRDHPTIVSLNPCTDAILAKLAEPDQILAISHYSHDPRASSMDMTEARRWPATGGTAEEVIALAPDLVIAGGFLSPSTRSAFERLGIRVETLGIAASVEESVDQVRKIAALTRHPERGKQLAAEIQDAVAKVAPAEGIRPVKALMWQQGGLVAGDGALISELMRKAGFASHAAARGLGQGAYLPLEEVLADPPELILTAGRDDMLDHPALRKLDHTRTVNFEPSLLYCGGPTIIRAVDRLAQIRRGIGA